MAEWFEVFDAKGVLVRARRRANRLMLVYALVSVVLIAAAPVAAFLFPEAGFWIAAGCAVALIGHGSWLIVRLNRLHRKLWRLDLSVHRALGFDTGRRSRVLRWPNVHRVEIDDDGLTLIGRTHGAAVRLGIPTAFPRYTALAHRIVDYAEAHDRPVWVDGRPWQALDLEVLYPFLAQETASGKGPRTAA